MPRRVARGRNHRVVLNRAAVAAMELGAADGLQAEGEGIIEEARPRVWDRPPFGHGIVESGKAVTYVDGKKVAGQGTAPRGAAWRGRVVTIVGYDFPARFQELGRTGQQAEPVLTPTMASRGPKAGQGIVGKIKARLAGVR